MAKKRAKSAGVHKPAPKVKHNGKSGEDSKVELVSPGWEGFGHSIVEATPKKEIWDGFGTTVKS